jgi:hypothetical protein
MIRIPTEDGWLLVRHADHARVAGEYARHWGNELFLPPEPLEMILEGVSRHDDAWIGPDAEPNLTASGEPGAFSKNLVGKYSAFEGIDLAGYLGVRGQATEVVARENPYAATLISMHTVNLLTAQADLSTLDPAGLELHGKFIAGQRQRQLELHEAAREEKEIAPFVTRTHFGAAFRFLQCCDSLSLVTCVRYPEAIDLRHPQATSDHCLQTIRCTPLGDDRYTLAPFPFPGSELKIQVPYRKVTGKTFPSVEAFREAYHAAKVETFEVTLIAAS